MPEADDCTVFHEFRRRTAEPDKNLSGNQELNRRQRVHHDTQRAVIGVARGSVPNGRMGHRREYEQYHAHSKCKPQVTQL